MALNPEWYICPIFKKAINVGLCWEICFADHAIKKEAVPEIMEYIKKYTMTIDEVQEKFCAQCRFCQWNKK